MLHYVMPMLNNARHEIFAQKVAAGLPALAAYAEAGFKPDRGHAARLAANGSVSERIAELQREAGAAFAMDRDAWLRRLERNADRCHAEGKHNAERQALKEIGLALAWYASERSRIQETANASAADPLTEMLQSPAALEAIVRSMQGVSGARERLLALLTA